MKNKIFLAPLAGITDLGFRLRALQYGADMVFIPMINCNAIVRNNKATLNLLATTPDEKPKAVQIFGTRIDVITKAAKIIVDKTRCDMIDFNMGCPDKNIISQGAGAALLKRPAKIGQIVKALKKTIDVPLSVKIRIGFDKLGYKENIKAICDGGADMLIVHARTARQGYSGKADLQVIKRIKQEVSIPVVGNGDVTDEKSAQEMLRTGCDHIMIGRGSLGRPYIFKMISHYLSKGEYLDEKFDPSLEFEQYVRLCKKTQTLDFNRVKHHLMNFTKGMDEGTRLRRKISRIKDLAKLLEFQFT